MPDNRQVRFFQRSTELFSSLLATVGFEIVRIEPVTRSLPVAFFIDMLAQVFPTTGLPAVCLLRGSFCLYNALHVQAIPF